MNPSNKNCTNCAKPSKLSTVVIIVTIALCLTSCTSHRYPVGTTVIKADGETIEIIYDL